MQMKKLLFILLSLMALTVMSLEENTQNGPKPAKVSLLSCSGCRLNRLPKVKAFIKDVAPHYDLEIKYVGGDPRLVFVDEAGKEMSKVDISGLDSAGIEGVLNSNGFMKKSNEQNVAPDGGPQKTPEVYRVQGEQARKVERAEL